jgi:hypothetical protein
MEELPKGYMILISRSRETNQVSMADPLYELADAPRESIFRSFSCRFCLAENFHSVLWKLKHFSTETESHDHVKVCKSDHMTFGKGTRRIEFADSFFCPIFPREIRNLTSIFDLF